MAASGDEPGRQNEHFRRGGRTLLRLALSYGGISRAEALIAESLFEITAEGLERLERSTHSLEGRKQVLRKFTAWHGVLKKLLVQGISAGREHLRSLREITELVASSDDVRQTQEAEMRRGNYDAISFYLEQLEGAVYRVEGSPILQKSLDLSGQAEAEDGSAGIWLTADRTAENGKSAAETERWWRNGYMLGSGTGTAVAGGVAFGLVCPPAAIGAGVFAVSSAFFGWRSHKLAGKNDEVNAEMLTLHDHLDSLFQLAMFVSCELVDASLILDTVRRNTVCIREVLSRDWSSSGNAVKQVYVRDAVAKCRERVAQRVESITQIQDELDDFRKRISPKVGLK